MTEEWRLGSPQRSEAVSSYRDYLSDLSEEGEHETEEMDVIDETNDEERQHQEPPPASRRRGGRRPVAASPQNHNPLTPTDDRQQPQQQEEEEEAEGFQKILSPFSPEFRRQRQADLTVDTSSPRTGGGVGWQPTTPLEDCTLSLSNERKVTVMVHVRNPPPKEMEGETGRLPCVLPLETFSAANLGRSKLLSPTALAMSSAMETQKLMVVNPEAFGKNISNEVTMEVLKKIVGRHVSSEDWVRLFRFSQVLWPEGALMGFCRMAQAISRDLTAPASIANRTILAHGQANKQFTLFGTSCKDNVTKAFASKDPATSLESDRLQQITDIMERFGLIGLTVHELLKTKEMQTEITLGLTMLEITGDDRFVDLNKKWSNHRSANDGSDSKDDGPRLLYSGDTGGGVMQGLDIREVDSLKSLGQFFRRCFMMANKQPIERGHIIASVYVYRNDDEIGETARVPVAHFVDLANPVALDLTKETTEIGRALTIRNASVRKTMSTLGATLRNSLLKEAGNHVTLPFRESLLTKVLQKSIEKADGRVILLTSVSAMISQYHSTMHSLLFCNNLLEKQGEPPKSPFDAMSKAATNATSPTSHTSDNSEQGISLSEFDPSYEKDLLPMVTGDARQRLTRAGFQPTPAVQNDVYLSTNVQETETDEQQQSYVELDPGDFEAQPSSDKTNNKNRTTVKTSATPRKGLPPSLLPTPQAGNSSKISRLRGQIPTGRDEEERTPGNPRANNSIELDTMEYGGLSATVEHHPSPITTDTGVGSYQRQSAKQPAMRQSNSYDRQMDDLSAELRQKATLGQSGSVTDDQEMDELSIEVKERARHANILKYLGSSPQQSHDQMLLSLGVVDKSPRNSPQRPNRSSPSPPPPRRTAETHRQKQTPSAIPQSDRLPPRSRSRVHNIDSRSPPPKLNVYGDSDNDTDTQIGEIDDKYVQLSQNQQANAQSVSKHLRQLRESEKEVIQRITTERDSYRAELSHISNERKRELDRHANEEQKLRRELASREDEKRSLSSELEQVKATVAEFNEIAEEAVAGRESLERQLDELRKKLVQMKKETVPKESLEAERAENQRISQALLEEREKASKLESETKNQMEQILGLESSLQSRDVEIEQRKDIQARDARRISELESELIEAKSEVSSLKREVEDLATEATDARRNLQVREQEFLEELNNIERERDVARAEQSELTEMMEKVKAEYGELQNVAHELEDTLRSERKERETKVEMLQQSIEVLKNDLDARAADVTDLVDVNQELEAAKTEVEASLEVEREAKEKLQGMNDYLKDIMDNKAPEEILKHLRTFYRERNQKDQQRQLQLANENERLVFEINELRRSLDVMRSEMERMRASERRYRDEFGIQVHQMCQRCHQLATATGTQNVLLSRDQETLENLALDLSLTIREFNSHTQQRRGDVEDLAELQRDVEVVEQIVPVLLKAVRERAAEIQLLAQREN